jgi:type IX secretion system PorP/SprF family membrane protein
VIRRLLVVALIGLVGVVQGQDIPLFSQKLTNSFIYNPSFAGLEFGSLTFSRRSNYSNVQGAPVNNFLSLHTPFANNRFGIGMNIFQEDVNILKNTYASAAFAYHINFDKYSKLSFGVSGEYNSLRLNGADLNFPEISQDVVLDNLRNGKNNSVDFSFGTSYANQYVKLGFAMNRLGTAWLKPDSTKLLSNYYSGFAQGTIRLRGDQDMLEPYIAYRKFSETNNTWDVGVFYTYNNKITAGGAARKGGVFNFTLAYHLSKYLMVGYSREMLTKGLGGFVGASNEFTVRLDFNNQTSKVKFKDDYKNSLSYRRKTLTTSAAKRTTSGGRNPKQLHKAQKRVASYSPNKRYQNTAKLAHGKKMPVKKSYNSAGNKKKKKKSPARKPVKRKPMKYPSRRR